MPTQTPDPNRPVSDWTQGRLKWAIALTIAGLGLAGLGWSILQTTPSTTSSSQTVGIIRDASPEPSQQAPTLPTSAAGSDTPDRALPTSAEMPPDSSPSFAKLIRINQAPASELMLLPGIGEARARLIIESREIEGPFRIPSDLERVSGIGPKTRERIAPMISFE